MQVVAYIGPSGSGKSIHAIEEIVHSLKQGLPVSTNIPINLDAMAAYVGITEEQLSKLLQQFTYDDVRKDNFWPNESNTGFVKNGRLVVIDEAGELCLDKTRKMVSGDFLRFITQYRHWKADDTEVGGQIRLIAQTRKLLPEAILQQIEFYWSFDKNYLVDANQFIKKRWPRGARRPATTETGNYNKALFPLYKSTDRDNMASRDNSKKLVFWRQKGFVKLCVMTAVSITTLTGGTVMAFDHFKKSGQTGKVQPYQPPQSKVVQGDIPVAPSSVVSPSIVGFSSAGEAAVGNSPLLSAASPLRPQDIEYRVLRLKGDPAAVQSAGATFCKLTALCEVVVDAPSEQVLIFGQSDVVAKAEKMIAALASRPAGRLVTLYVIQSDTDKGDQFDQSFNVGNDVAFRSGGDGSANLLIGWSRFRYALGVGRSSGDLRVLSTAQLNLWPGQSATVKSGASVPVIAATSVDQSGRETQQVNYLESGLLIRVDQLSAGERPVLKINLEASNFSATALGVKANPTKNLRLLEAVSELPDCTVSLIGGIDIMNEEASKTAVLGFTTSKTDRRNMRRMWVALAAASSSSLCDARDAGGQ